MNESTLVIAWLIIFGACLGSFLNVVVYRLPRGKSLVSPPSHCPHCTHPIRWFDNIPVFGWLQLGGKCRDCAAPISVQYPVIEGICGGIFGLVALSLFHHAGETPLLVTTCESLCFSLFFVTLLAAGLIERQNLAVPKTIFVPVFFLSLLTFFFFDAPFAKQIYNVFQMEKVEQMWVPPFFESDTSNFFLQRLMCAIVSIIVGSVCLWLNQQGSDPLVDKYSWLFAYTSTSSSSARTQNQFGDKFSWLFASGLLGVFFVQFAPFIIIITFLLRWTHVKPMLLLTCIAFTVFLVLSS
ncbi:MAG: prepilin peptidase [Thermoguttaceae bacterium]